MLCWDKWDDPKIWQALRSVGVSEIELVPTKVWPGWNGFSAANASEVRKRIENEGFTIPSAQSLAFGIQDAAIFSSDVDGGATGTLARQRRENLLRHLEQVLSVGETLGVKFYVFGSPGLRLRINLSSDVVNEISQEFFKTLGDMAAAKNGVIALEANAVGYGCDWLTNTTELESFVDGLNHPSIGLHLDIGNMKMMNEDLQVRLDRLLSKSVHFHLSAPMMAPVTKSEVLEIRELLSKTKNRPRRISLEQKYINDEKVFDSLTAMASVSEWEF